MQATSDRMRDHKRTRGTAAMSSPIPDRVRSSGNKENTFIAPAADYRDESPPPERIIKPLSSPPPVRRVVRSLPAMQDNSAWPRQLTHLFGSPDDRPMLKFADNPPPVQPVRPLGPMDENTAGEFLHTTLLSWGR